MSFSVEGQDFGIMHFRHWLPQMGVQYSRVKPRTPRGRSRGAASLARHLDPMLGKQELGSGLERVGMARGLQDMLFFLSFPSLGGVNLDVSAPIGPIKV